jgi:hypothetical protein
VLPLRGYSVRRMYVDKCMDMNGEGYLKVKRNTQQLLLHDRDVT